VGGASVTEPDLNTMTCIHLCPSYPYDEPHLAYPYGLRAFADPKPARKAIPSREPVNPNLILHPYRNTCRDWERGCRSTKKRPDLHSLPQNLFPLNQTRHCPHGSQAYPPVQMANVP
jgi:hypothetical protein